MQRNGKKRTKDSDIGLLVFYAGVSSRFSLPLPNSLATSPPTSHKAACFTARRPGSTQASQPGLGRQMHFNAKFPHLLWLSQLVWQYKPKSSFHFGGDKFIGIHISPNFGDNIPLSLMN